MRLTIDKCLAERLLRLRETQMPFQGGYIADAEAAFGTPCIVAHYALGLATLLGLNGMVIWYNSAEDQPPVVLDDVRSIGWAVRKAAKNHNLPEVLQLMPPMPADGRVCPMCQGQGWDDTPTVEYPIGVVCMMCRGLGWLPGIIPAVAPSRSSAPVADCPAD